ncbi:hypothetical protein DUI87_03916 [Hirundo rustica rustica]|uniref:Uncharacterized protein n=1 Tax=Hirundo rustica rustica TaxID=333673 RepID=A0A3M0L1H4_HIRRU|nr:hypothetical protein DUI87_03916 [Hirundo rustica rustica]
MLPVSLGPKEEEEERPAYGKFLGFYRVTSQQCNSLLGRLWVDTQCPPPLPSSAGQERENIMKVSWIGIRTERDYSTITITGRGNPEWCGEWEDMGQLLKEFSDPVVWDFPREQIQNPVELGKYLKERYHDGSKGEKITAVSWALAYAYRTLLETVGQQTEAVGKGYKSTATPVTQAAANTPVMKPAAKLEPEPELAAKADSKPKPLAVALAKKHTVKTD